MMASGRNLRTAYSENRCMDPGLGFPDLWLKLCNQENLMASIKKPIFVCFDLSVCKKLSGEPILMKVSNRLSDILRTVFLMSHFYESSDKFTRVHFRSNIKRKVSNIYLTEKWRKVDSEEWEVSCLNPYMSHISWVIMIDESYQNISDSILSLGWLIIICVGLIRWVCFNSSISVCTLIKNLSAVFYLAPISDMTL